MKNQTDEPSSGAACLPDEDTPLKEYIFLLRSERGETDEDTTESARGRTLREALTKLLEDHGDLLSWEPEDYPTLPDNCGDNSDELLTVEWEEGPYSYTIRGYDTAEIGTHSKQELVNALDRFVTDDLIGYTLNKIGERLLLIATTTQGNPFAAGRLAECGDTARLLAGSVNRAMKGVTWNK